jgi:DMSO/TMAO reductase YedYZ molybdopterin-dependent catalytic subunit
MMQMASVTQIETLVCPGVYEETHQWTGVPLTAILSGVSVNPGATQVTIAGNGYTTNLSLQDVQSGGAFLAYMADGSLLTQDGGYPLRLVLPNVVGTNWVRWVDHLELG